MFGAFITVVALAVEPFTQNLVAARSCQIPSSSQPALIPYANYYYTYDGQQITNATTDFMLWGNQRYGLEPAMKASVYSGLYGSATTVINASTIRAYCPGINCTYPRYTTLGICHACADISSFIKSDCDPTPPLESVTHVFQPRCNWSLPNGQSLQIYPDINDYLNAYGALQVGSMDFIVANSTLSTLKLPNIPGTFTNVSILANASSNPNCTIGSSCGVGPDGIIPTMDFNPIAAECSLFPCARTYTASVVNGSVVEVEVKRTLGQGRWMFDIGDPPYPVDVVIDPNENCTVKFGRAVNQEPCNFTARTQFIMAAGNFFWHFWNGTVSGRTFDEAAPSNDALGVLYNDAFTNFTQIDRVLGTISDSMTAAIRQTGQVFGLGSDVNSGQGYVTGQVFLADTCIGVRWNWIALPAIVVLLTLLLLVLTLVHGRATGDRSAWKTSSLPVLFHGLSTDGLASNGQLLAAIEMNREAKRLKVRLIEKSDGTWCLEQWQTLDDDPS